jgi:hypothetical protein
LLGPAPGPDKQILACDKSLFRRELGDLPQALREEIRRAMRDFLDI